jgi:DNA polymerase-3 subunit delta
MKVQANQVNRFLKNIPQEIIFILVYGVDFGLVNQRVKELSTTFLGQDNLDNAKYFYEADLKSDSQLLNNQLNNLSLFGSDKNLIILREIKEFGTKLLADYLTQNMENTLIMVEAGELSPSSSLRKLAENNDNALAIPCYQDSIQSLKELIAKKINQHNFKIDSQAMDFLVNNLGNNRLVSEAEIDKLILYKYQQKNITLNDALNGVVDQSTFGFDTFSHALFSGNIKQAYEDLLKLLEDENPITIIRILLNYLQKLHMAKIELELGNSMEDVIKNIKPAIFFSYVDSFKMQLRSWNLDNLKKLFGILLNLEITNKTNQHLGQLDLKHFVLNFKSYI